MPHICSLVAMNGELSDKDQDCVLWAVNMFNFDLHFDILIFLKVRTAVAGFIFQIWSLLLG